MRLGLRQLVHRLRGSGSATGGSALPAGYLPIAQTEPADVFIAAYPKSGNTWFQSLVAGAIYGLDPELASDSLIQDLVPDVHYKALYRRYRTPMFFKTHHLPRPEYRRVVYLLRDGRDALVSYWHHLQALEGRPLDFTELVNDGRLLVPCPWHEHVEAWAHNPYDAAMLMIRYEDLKHDPLRELQRFCAFVDEPRETAVLQRATDKSSFAVMQQKERRLGWDNRAWPANRPFVRRGAIGSYKDEMPSEVLALVMAQAGATLQRFGYA